MEVVEATTPTAGEFLEVCAVFIAMVPLDWRIWGIDRLLEMSIASFASKGNQTSRNYLQGRYGSMSQVMGTTRLEFNYVS
jgi:hypothetical protein